MIKIDLYTPKRLFTKLIAISILIIISANSLCAQSGNITIKGRLINEQTAPIAYASAVLKNDEQKIIAGAISDTAGVFSLQGNFIGNYTLDVSYLYYHSIQIPIEIGTAKDDRFFDLGAVTLIADKQLIGNVEVIAERDMQAITVDKVQVQSKKGTSAVTGNVLDALRNVSAITIDNQDNVSIRGNSNVLILVDGIPTTLSSLGAIPSASTENIEVIYAPDASYDAEGSGGIINITTNKQNKTPLNGMVSVNYGFNNKINSNLALNYSGKKLSLGVQYNIKYEEDIIESDMERLFHASNNVVKQDIYTMQFVNNHVVRMNIGYKISKKEMLNFNASYAYLGLRNEQTFQNSYYTANNTSTSHRFNDISWNRNVLDGNLKYTKMLKNKGDKFSILAAFSQTQGRRPVFYYEDDLAIQKSNTQGKPLNAVLQSDITIKKEKGVWDSGVKLTYRSNTNRYQFYEMVDEIWKFSDLFSNDLHHQEIIPALYAMYTSTHSKERKFSYKLGLRTEYSCARIESEKEKVNYLKQSFFVAPSVLLQYKINDHQSFSTTLSRRITRPKYPQLIPYVNMIDDKTFETGNRNLNPEKNTTLELGYQLIKKKISLHLREYITLSQDYITQISMVYPAQNDALMLTYVNGGIEFKTGVDLNLSIKIIKQIRINIGNNIFYGTTTGYYKDNDNTIDLASSGWMNNANASLDILPLPSTKIQVQYFVTSPQYHPQFTIETNHYMNVGITQSLLKNKLTISVLLTDPFNTSVWNIYSDNPSII